MVEIPAKELSFIRSTLSESDGSASTTRVCIVLVVVFSLGFVSALLWKVHGPISVDEFCHGVGSLGMFAGGICTALYGVNRAADVFNNRAGGPQQ